MSASAVAFREIARGLQLPEGPVVLRDGRVLVCEVLGGCVTAIDPRDGHKQTVAVTGGGPNGAALGPNGACYVCNNGGIETVEIDGKRLPRLETSADAPPGSIQRVDLDSGRVETLYTGLPDRPLRAPNDLVFDAHGGFWFTDHGKVRARDRDRGSVWYARADGSGLECVIAPLDTPNGIGLSPDGRTLYVAETITGHLLAFDVIAPGRIDTRHRSLWSAGGRVLARAGPGMALDSLAIDDGGFICVATPGRGGILVVTPDGRSSTHLPLPDPIVTNLCFGGPERRTAFVTLGYAGLLLAIERPRPGLALHHGG